MINYNFVRGENITPNKILDLNSYENFLLDAVDGFVPILEPQEEQNLSDELKLLPQFEQKFIGKQKFS